MNSFIITSFLQGTDVWRLLKLWTNDTPLRNIALKAIYVMSSLRQPSKMPKAKDHLEEIERRLILW